MNITNYHPEKIKKDFEELQDRINKENSILKRRFKTKIIAMCLVVAILAIASVTVLVYSIMQDTYTAAIGLFISILLLFACILISLGCLERFLDGPEIIDISLKETFPIKFWRLYTNAKVLEIANESDTIIITYCMDDNIVQNTRMKAVGVVVDNTITEPVLNVDHGYILQPIESFTKIPKEV